MAIPTYDQLIEPLLRALGGSPDGLMSREARARVAEAIAVRPEDLKERLASGRQAVFDNRVGWAHDRLKRAGLSTSVRRGFWRLTPVGLDRARELDSRPMTEDEVRDLAVVADDSTAKPNGSPTPKPIGPWEPAPKLAPSERIDQAVAELNASLAAELLDTIGRGSPDFFERLVLDVLQAMGYGTSSTIEHTGKSGDGGIDGIITLDRLGLEKVYIQAKRWQGPVGRPEIQGFFGALASRRATKGVFITTSRFTKEAVEFASNASDSLVLVDGEQLTRLMVEFEVGVSVERTIKLCHPDSDYFEEG
ncbi:MAG: restriction endonuclease [Myxococcales bacterium]|nr:restriction endonuclease [Myxococcales bacterium]